MVSYYLFSSTCAHSAVSSPCAPAGEYILGSLDGTYSGVTSIEIHPQSKSGIDYTNEFTEVTKNQVITVLQVNTPYGFTARVSADPVIGTDGQISLLLRDVKAIDDPNGTDLTGSATIKVQDIIDPKNINELNNIIEGLNGSFNNIADLRCVVMTDDNVSLPAYLPSGNAIPDGKLYFNSRYLQLYIRVGGSWLGLL